MSSVAEILNGLKSQITPEMVKKTKTVFVFEIGGKPWTLDLKKEGTLKEGKPKKADCTLIMTEAVFMDLFTGKMNAQTGLHANHDRGSVHGPVHRQDERP